MQKCSFLLLTVGVLSLIGVRASAEDYARGYGRANSTPVDGSNYSDAGGIAENNWGVYPNINPHMQVGSHRAEPDYYPNYGGF